MFVFEIGEEVMVNYPDDDGGYETGIVVGEKGEGFYLVDFDGTIKLVNEKTMTI